MGRLVSRRPSRVATWNQPSFQRHEQREGLQAVVTPVDEVALVSTLLSATASYESIARTMKM